MEGEDRSCLYLVGIVFSIFAIFLAGIGILVGLAMADFGDLLNLPWAGEGGEVSGPVIDCGGATKVPQVWMPWVREAANKYLEGNQAQLVALIQVESGWNPRACYRGSENSDATGLGQFLASTASGFPEFVGGDDKHGRRWPSGKLYSHIQCPPSDDARYDPERSIFATAHLLRGHLRRYGNLRTAYIEGYHGYCKQATPKCQRQKAGAERSADKLMSVYNQLIERGQCK